MLPLTLQTVPYNDAPHRLDLQATTDLIVSRGGLRHYTREMILFLVTTVDEFGVIFPQSRRLIMGQINHETGFLTYTGDVRWWQFNLAGIGATGGIPGHVFTVYKEGYDPREHAPDDLEWINWRASIVKGVAAVFVHHMVYNFGEAKNWPKELQQHKGADPRYQNVLDAKKGGTVHTIEGYGRNWAIGASYGPALVNAGNLIPVIPEGAVSPVSLKLAFATGHHNTSGGNPDEFRLTAELAEEYVRVGLRLGHDVRSITPDGPDPDTDPGDGSFPGGLADAAYTVVRWANEGWVAKYFTEVHFQGLKYGSDAGRGHFIIHPDWGTDIDTDIRDGFGPLWARIFRDHVGMPMWTDGVMSEKQTGVGLGGDRLGVFRVTEPVKVTTSRSIIEHGSHTSPSDAAIINQPQFNTKAVEAFYIALHQYEGLPAPNFGQAPPVEPPPTPNNLVINGFYLVDEIRTKWESLEPDAYSVLGPPKSGMYLGPVDGVFRKGQIFEKGALVIYEEGTPHGVPVGHPMRVRNLFPWERTEFLTYGQSVNLVAKDVL